MSTGTINPTLRQHHPATLDPRDINRISWDPVPGCPGVRAKELWRSPGAIGALLSYGPDASTPGHPHPHAQHHIWVLAGGVVVAGRRLVAGSYIDVPVGVAHPIRTVGRSGALLLQVHHRSAAVGRQP
jgi:quercetin dioxygenase-like cupin family protein